ncbi:nuclear condensing complex subunit [Phakopsora pachyrhizi]|nr:nuclear condensing complex subunit [Phakopsora pachyrhizi]
MPRQKGTKTSRGSRASKKKDSIDSQEIRKPSEISSKASDRVTKPSSNHPSDEMMTNLSNSILNIFNKSQNSITSHRKLVIHLHSVFLSAIKIRDGEDEDEKASKDSSSRIRLIGERVFTETIYSVLDHLVITKKGVTEADRVIKFLRSFFAFATENEKSSQKDSSDQSPISRFLLHVIKYLNRGFEAKNKIVRYRCCQILAYVVSGLEEIDDSLFSELKEKLMIRVHDKEKDVRQQAAMALMNFRPVDDGEENVNDALIDLMIRDPSSDVRRTVLHGLCEAPTVATLSAVLTRLRDIDPVTRRTVYRDLYLATNIKPEPTLPHDPAKCYTLDQRHLILKGLQDREEGVRKEATNLINCWIRLGYGGNIESFLSKMDLIELASDEEEDEHVKIKLENIERAIKSWVAIGGLNSSLDEESAEESESKKKLEFCSEEWWNNLKPEGAFLLRVVAEHYESQQELVRLDEVMPVVTALAFRIEHNFQDLLDLLNENNPKSLSNEMEQDGDEDETVRRVLKATQKTLVIRELLIVAMMADYGDEIGRRKMFSLLRGLVSDPLLPHSLIPGCLEVLLKLSTGERDFMRVIVELVQELRCNLEPDPNLLNSTRRGKEANGEEEDDDEGEGEASFRGGRNGGIQVAPFTVNPANASLDLRCLTIVKALLERVSGSIKDNTSIFGIVHELIIPAVKCKDGPIRERGILCLGLCCMLDKQMALDSFTIFVQQSQAAEMDLRVKVLKIVIDLLLQHGIAFLAEKGHSSDRVVEFLLHVLDQDSKEIQATAAIGISKLMLSGIVTSSEVLQMLVLVYFSPETCDNQKLRQCLSYFLPVYCFCSSVNQRRMQSMVLPALDVLSGVYDDQEEKVGMLSPIQIAMQLIDWTDPSKVVELPGCQVDWEIHLDTAIEIIKNLYRVKEKDERKMYCQMLAKLNLPDDLECDVKLKGLTILINDLLKRRTSMDSISQNTLKKFKMGLKTKFSSEQLIEMTEEEFKEKEEGSKEVFEFIDQLGQNEEYGNSDEDEDGDEDERNCMKINSDQGGDSDDFSVKVAPKKKSLKKALTAIPSKLRKDSDDESNSNATPRRSSRARVSRKSDQKSLKEQEKLEELIGSSTDEDESNNDDDGNDDDDDGDE